MASYVTARLGHRSTELDHPTYRRDTPALHPKGASLHVPAEPYYPGEPKPGYIAPWDETPEWEREAAAAVYEQVRQFAEVSGGHSAKLTCEQQGRFVALCWIAQIYKHFEDPKPSYVADWQDLPAWQQQTDADISTQSRATFPQRGNGVPWRARSTFLQPGNETRARIP